MGSGYTIDGRLCARCGSNPERRARCVCNGAPPSGRHFTYNGISDAIAADQVAPEPFELDIDTRRAIDAPHQVIDTALTNGGDLAALAHTPHSGIYTRAIAHGMPTEIQALIDITNADADIAGYDLARRAGATNAEIYRTAGWAGFPNRVSLADYGHARMAGLSDNDISDYWNRKADLSVVLAARNVATPNEVDQVLDYGNRHLRTYAELRGLGVSHDNAAEAVCFGGEIVSAHQILCATRSPGDTYDDVVADFNDSHLCPSPADEGQHFGPGSSYQRLRKALTHDEADAIVGLLHRRADVDMIANKDPGISGADVVAAVRSYPDRIGGYLSARTTGTHDEAIETLAARPKTRG